MRVVFMGTGEFAVPVLEALVRVHSVVGVYTRPDRPIGRGQLVCCSPVKKTALSWKLPIFQPEKLATSEEWDRLQVLQPEVIVVTDYGQILRKNVLNLPPRGCFNVHPSLLPRWRGAAPIPHAILAGDEWTGVSIIRLVEKLDAGDVFLQEARMIGAEDTAEQLQPILAQMGGAALLQVLERLEKNIAQCWQQDESSVTYAEKLSKEMQFLDPQESALKLEWKVRALNPWPGSVLRCESLLKIKKAKAHPNLVGPQGQIFEKSGMLFLGTSAGCLQLERLQWEGKKELEVVAFVNGMKGRHQGFPLRVRGE